MRAILCKLVWWASTTHLLSQRNVVLHAKRLYTEEHLIRVIMRYARGRIEGKRMFKDSIWIVCYTINGGWMLQCDEGWDLELCFVNYLDSLSWFSICWGWVLLHITFWICCATSLFSAGVVLGLVRLAARCCIVICILLFVNEMIGS